MKSSLIIILTAISFIIRLMSITCFRGVGAFTIITSNIKRNGGLIARHQSIMMAGTSMSSVTNSTSSPVATTKETLQSSSQPPPLYLAEGLVAIHKPLTWTSNDVVAYIRGILTRDAKDRGYDEDNNNNNNINNKNNKKKRGRRKKQLMKVGHGGTLDPLASGVLVLGVGKGTTLLQNYLQGDKQYTATCELGYETDTLDAEGKLVKTLPWDHVTDIMATVEEKIVPKFTGKIQQVPPLYSAIRVDGKRLYEIARSTEDPDTKADDVEIPKREVEVYGLQVGSTLDDSVICSGLVDGPRYREEVQRLEKVAEASAKTATEDVSDGHASNNEDSDNDEEKESKSKRKRQRRGGRNDKKKNETKKCPFNEQTVPAITSANNNLQLPQFSLNVQCGGGTYIRSLVRDIGYELDTVATMTGLVCTQITCRITHISPYFCTLIHYHYNLLFH